tara:strand:- start:139 stop:1236 length:1098 start_codon:yes stop_codon:yes gene_type:complete
MATSGTPIRLVREDGELIELNATKIVMSTDRRFGPKSVPFSGSNRVSLDLNLNKAVILIQGFFSDDEIAVGGKKAVATVDFNVGKDDNGDKKPFATSTNLTVLFAAIQNTKLVLRDVNGTYRGLDMVSGSSNSYNSSTKTVTIKSDASPAQIATIVKTGLDASYSSHFTTEIVNGEYVADGNANNSKLIITQTSDGVNGNSGNSPSFSLMYPYAIRIPKTTDFAGGKTASRKSAGDKAQDMYSIMNNSSRKTLRAAGRRFKSIFDSDKHGKVSNGGSDYIVGILIPFNSILTDGEYTPRNFFMPTGFFDKGEKTSKNAKAAGTQFNEVDNFTGISGGMKSMELMYDAGEAIYTFDMQFLPSDVML